MQQFNYEEESKRLQALNQRFAFLMNGVMFVKTRQASGNKDMALEILGQRTEQALEDMIRTELDRKANEGCDVKNGLLTLAKDTVQ